MKDAPKTIPRSYLRRAEQKFKDFTKYNFSRTSDPIVTESDVLNILQELLRESDVISDAYFFSRAILLHAYQFDSEIYLFEEEAESQTVPGELKVLGVKLPSFRTGRDLGKGIYRQIVEEKTIIPPREKKRVFVPLKGKPTLTTEITYPANILAIFGALEVKSKRALSPYETLFIEKYARRLGSGIHHGLMLEYNRRLVEHIIEMLTIVSHDIRSPLTGISVGLKVVSKELYGPLDPKVKAVVDGLYRKAEDLCHTLNKSLERSRILSGNISIEKEVLDLTHDIIDPLVDEFSETFESNNVSIDPTFGGIPSGSILIKADKIWLQNVYRNLFSNVIKHGGTGCSMAYGFEDKGDHFRLNVFNTGRPLTKEEQKGLFEKFSRPSRKGGRHIEGHGLGLYSCKKIVEEHGGRMWYEAKSDGSNFVFTLPKE